MKKVFYLVFFLFLTGILYGELPTETLGEDNVFQQSENNSQKLNGNQTQTESQMQTGPNGPPLDDIPIDQYLPLLFIMANALLVYKFKSKKANIKS